MGLMRGTTLFDLPNSEAKRRRFLGGTIDLFAMAYLLGAASQGFPNNNPNSPTPGVARSLTRIRREHNAYGGRIMSVAPQC